MSNRETVARKIHSLTGGSLMFGTIMFDRFDVCCDDDGSVAIMFYGAPNSAVLPKGLTYRQIADKIEQMNTVEGVSAEGLKVCWAQGAGL